jgi:hypothetical protein
MPIKSYIPFKRLPSLLPCPLQLWLNLTADDAVAYPEYKRADDVVACPEYKRDNNTIAYLEYKMTLSRILNTGGGLVMLLHILNISNLKRGKEASWDLRSWGSINGSLFGYYAGDLSVSLPNRHSPSAKKCRGCGVIATIICRIMFCSSRGA